MVVQAPSAPRVLILEDERQIAVNVEGLLRGAGYAVTSVGSVAEALTALDTESFDYGLLDIRLRDGNSSRVAEALARRGIAFAFCAGDKEKPLAFEHVPILSKPVGEAELLATLDGALAAER